MLDDTSRFEGGTLQQNGLQRTSGHARVLFKRRGDSSALGDLRQSGAMKVRLPKVPAGVAPEAVLINAAGGLTGGDRLSFEGVVEPGARGTLTTQACERVYRSLAGDAEMNVELRIGDCASLAWLPQETILLDGGRLRRRLDVDMEADSRFLAIESLILGRAAMGETVTTGHFMDQWRIRLAGRLLHAEAQRLAGDLQRIGGGSAALGNMRAVSTILLVAPDAEARLDGLRATIDTNAQEGALVGAGAMAHRLIVRAAAPDGQTLRKITAPLLRHLTDGRELPRVWST